ncbi:MAG: hypothetical protein H6845_00245 [Alphaproteobacteria bacterium]|nr:MAG: hypothetical protein H6845_00245 [Alphaproteobacteria bacterium]
MQKSYKSKLVLSSVILFILASVVGILDRRTPKIGKLPINSSRIIAYKASDKNILIPSLLNAYYLELGLRVPEELIVRAAQRLDSKLPVQVRMLLGEDNVAMLQLSKIIHLATNLINSHISTLFSKGVTQRRTGLKAVYDHKSIKVRVNEHELKDHYFKNQIKFSSGEKVTRGRVFKILSNQVDLQQFKKLFKKGEDLIAIKNKYNGTIEPITWINGKNNTVTDSQLALEPNEKSTFLSNYKHHMYVIIDSTEGPTAVSYEKCRNKVKSDLIAYKQRELLKAHLKDVAKHLKWEEISETSLVDSIISQNLNKDIYVMFLTNENDINYYFDNGKTVLIKTTKIVQDESSSTDQKIQIADFIHKILVNSLIHSIAKSYKVDI